MKLVLGFLLHHIFLLVQLALPAVLFQVQLISLLSIMLPVNSLLGLAFLLLCTSISAVPYPANDPGAKPEDKPLPGRTDTSIRPNSGVVTGHEADDWIPEHMRHTQDSIKEFPNNAKPYPAHGNPRANRADRQKGIAKPGPHSESKEDRVLDEKTLNSQNNYNQQTDTTIRKLPHYESGGKFPKYEEERKESFQRETGKKYESSKMPDNSLKSKLFQSQSCFR